MLSGVRDVCRSSATCDDGYNLGRRALGRSLAMAALLLTTSAGTLLAQATPAPEPSYVNRCADCFGTTSFVEGAVGNPENPPCQSYAANLYENWNPAETAKAPQVDIQFARFASDEDFWYF